MIKIWRIKYRRKSSSQKVRFPRKGLLERTDLERYQTVRLVKITNLKVVSTPDGSVPDKAGTINEEVELCKHTFFYSSLIAYW